MSVTAWTQTNRYVVIFKDKDASSYSISNPLEFLSPRAISRRERQSIVITEQDLPVNTAYIQAVKDAGADVFYKTRWLNGVLIQCDASLVATLTGLSFVERVEYVAPNAKLMTNGRKKSSPKARNSKVADVTQTQLGMVGIDEMHTDGYHGEGMIVGIFDSGFQGVNVNEPFQSLFAENRIDLTVSHDLVYNTKDIFQYDEHGAEVFSVIAAHQEGTYTGGAYKASYQLFVTEDVNTEYRIEEYNWLFAAELADSAGVDVINSSLGYNTFDDASMDYPKAAMNGKTAIITRAAQWAADRGIVVVCSAGNEGAGSWQIITAPADAEDVLAVASVTSTGVRVASSSKGPSPAIDGIIKPDVAAMGSNTSVILPSGAVGTASGTSLAAPIITSLVTGIWQHYPSLTNKELLDIVRQSGSQASTPDNLLGYGIPNYLTVETLLQYLRENPFRVYPNPVIDDTLSIKPYSTSDVSSCQIEFVSPKGQSLFTSDLTFSKENPVYTMNVASLASGLYILRIRWGQEVATHRVVVR
jgi:subtilisin family serine protease